jgi:hypothetical protein
MVLEMLALYCPPVVTSISSCRESVLDHHLKPSSMFVTWQGDSHIIQEEIGISPVGF